MDAMPQEEMLQELKMNNRKKPTKNEMPDSF
jgi:hypothetical protein